MISGKWLISGLVVMVVTPGSSTGHVARVTRDKSQKGRSSYSYDYIDHVPYYSEIPKEQAYCDTLTLTGSENYAKNKLGDIYNGNYYRQNSVEGSRWLRDVLNSRDQSVDIFLQKGRFRAGSSQPKYGWLLGYEVRGMIRIRFIAVGDIECPADVSNWRMIERLKKFRNHIGRRTVYDLGRRIPRNTRLGFNRE